MKNIVDKIYENFFYEDFHGNVDPKLPKEIMPAYVFLKNEKNLRMLSRYKTGDWNPYKKPKARAELGKLLENCPKGTKITWYGGTNKSSGTNITMIFKKIEGDDQWVRYIDDPDHGGVTGGYEGPGTMYSSDTVIYELCRELKWYLEEIIKSINISLE